MEIILSPEQGVNKNIKSNVNLPALSQGGGGH